ncbi:hypothetical protein OPT61_g10611 [Boeremia exigua]|uniref:Uncharacterized protein n=1 Tax=Boeremia exigua TaxID=749465 RepID=A0ACC2HQA6_9PLEO|nr:hypothetical protein OPT61_g10611 [Boeremia exigua]
MNVVDGPAAQDARPQDKCRAAARAILLTPAHVSSIKIDPYLNVDAGTMNPKEYAARPPGPQHTEQRAGTARSSSSPTAARSTSISATTSATSTSP